MFDIRLSPLFFRLGKFLGSIFVEAPFSLLDEFESSFDEDSLIGVKNTSLWEGHGRVPFY